MNEQMKRMLQDAAILFIITLCSGLVLGFVYQLTKEPIAVQEKKAKDAACQEVFTDAAGFEVMEEEDIEAASQSIAAAGYEAQSLSDKTVKALDASGNLLGYVLTVTSGEGYGGDIIFAMGVRMDGTLNGISLLTIAETPGLGMKAEDILKPQFVNKNAEQYVYTKTGAMAENEIDTISGATITTRAITNGVNAGLEYFRATLSEGGNSNE